MRYHGGALHGMSTTEEYRRHAADCVRVSQTLTKPEDKALLMEMASIWLRLAERAEAASLDKPDQ